MKNFFRILSILYTIRAYRLDNFLFSRGIKAAKWLKYFFFFVPAKQEELPPGVRLKLAFEDLGPIWVKLGQLLSLREDFIPPEIADQLKLLQEDARPANDAEARAMIATQLGEQDYFQLGEALASASIAQVYSGTLDLAAFKAAKEAGKIPPSLLAYEYSEEEFSGKKEVIIKVLRPKVEKMVYRELGLMHKASSLFATYKDKQQKFRPEEIVQELENNFAVELNLEVEANNCQTMRKQWKDSPILYIPQVFLANGQVMIQERIYGANLNDQEALLAKNANLKVLAERGVEIFFSQLLKHNFFHADMHPGNIFANLEDPQNPGYMAIDFGIVGSLEENDKKYLVENLIAFFQQDYGQIAKSHINSGWVRGKIDQRAFEDSLRKQLAPLFNKPLNEISYANALKNLFDIARRFNMVVQPQLILLQKTLMYVEAMGKRLYPQLNLWHTAKPILEDWFKEEYSISNQGKKAAKHLPQLMGLARTLPDDVYRAFANHELILTRLEKIQSSQSKALSILFKMLTVLLLLVAVTSCVVLFVLGFPFLAILLTGVSLILLIYLAINFYL